MKPSKSNNNDTRSSQGNLKKPRSEIRDDLDNQKNKEAGYTGDRSKKRDRNKESSL